MKFDAQYSRLTNGVRTLIVPMPGVESVTAMILVKTGSRNETPEQSGISHVLEHMLFKGTKKYPSPMAIAETVDSIGAEQNAFTSKEYTGYYITSATRHLPLILDIQGEMINRPLIPSDDLKREREVIIEEINMYEDHPMERAAEEFENLMFEGSSMGRMIIGTKKTVRATSSADLKKYMSEWYKGSNILVVIAGKVGSKGAGSSVNSLIEANFGGLASSSLSGYTTVATYGKPESRHYKKKTEQAHFLLGVPALSMVDPRRYAMSLGQVVLGGGMSSRLFNEIREKRGLAYYVKADLDSTSDAGYLAVRSGVRLDKLGEAMKVVEDEMFGLAGTITDKEITKAKEYLLGRMPLSLEDSMGVAHFFGIRTLITDQIRQPEEAEAAIKNTTGVEVRKVLAEIVKPEEMRSVVVGPKGN